jgi:signal transduction histidine kinase
MRVVTTSDGAAIPYYASAWSTDGVRLDAVNERAGGLIAGDIVTSVAGRPLGDWLDRALDPGVDRSAVGGGETPLYGVQRAGAHLEVPVVLERHDVGAILLANWSTLLFLGVLQVIAAYVLLRRPGASAAVALVVAACGVTGSTIPWMLGLQVTDIVRGWPFVLHALTAGGIYMLLWPAGAIHLPLALTSGPSGPGRRSLALTYGIPLGAYVGGLVVARLVSASTTAWMGTWPVVQMLVIVPTIVVGVAFLVRRYRAAPAADRIPIRWAAFGGVAAMLGGLILLMGPQLLIDKPLVPWTMIGIIALPLPLGIAAGVLRDGLFDIDVVINRTLVYGGVTVAIAAVYAISVSMLGSVLRAQGGFPASLLATGLAAVVALPIRDFLQLAVNRLMYGDRDDPYRALQRLGQRLETTIDPVEAPQVIVRTVAESLRLPWVALRIGPEGAAGRTTTYGRKPPGEVVTVPLISGSEVVGDLLVGPRSVSEPLSVADRELLDVLARQAGAAIHALGLTLDLVASRERLVATREEERRRIRRDLHDGLGPTLAAIGMRAEIAADMVTSDPSSAARVLSEVRGDVNSALGEIRRLVDGLRPPALDELGLVGAIEAQAERLGPDLVVQVDADGPIPELPAAVEVAAYRIAVEAITNTARHAGAHTCRVRLIGSSGPEAVLEVEVTDDGRGLPRRLRPGIGLISMRERAAEVAGTCIVESRPGGGTRVFARLPLEGSGRSEMP